MLRRAFEAEVPARWVVDDTVYGTARSLRGWLEEKGRSYVPAVLKTKGDYYEGLQRQAQTVARELPQKAWLPASAGTGSKGERLYNWACVPLTNTEAAGAKHRAGRWLLVRRSIDDLEDLAYYLCYGPAQTNVHELIRIAGRRWQIEATFQEAR